MSDLQESPEIKALLDRLADQFVTLLGANLVGVYGHRSIFAKSL